MSGGRRRWHRIVIPFAVVAALFTLSGVSYAWQEPDFDEPGTLSPTGTGPDGSSRLAAALAERGVKVERQTRSADALRSALHGPATIFLPRPDFADPRFVWLLSTLPAPNRVVLVEPGRRDQHYLPVVPGATRWASRAPRPGCAEAPARTAGRAAALRTRYHVDPELPGRYRCYDGGLVGARWGQLDLVVVGATDPFRNGRLDEHGNAALATGLLSTRDRVIWLDLHAAEPESYSVVEGGKPRLDLPDADEDGPQGGSGESDSPLWTAVPPVFWPMLAQLALIAVLLALWRARRLGPPVPEPLPVVVPAAETVTGRARLYERADARGPALDALRAAARHRILPVLGLPPDAPEAEVVAAVTGRTTMSRERASAILYGPEPPDDAQLVAAAAALDTLVRDLTTETRRTGSR